MEHGPSAIPSASAMALSNQTIDARNADSINADRIARATRRNDKPIIDVVETSDRDPRERLEYCRQSSEHQNATSSADVVEAAKSNEQGPQSPGMRLDIQG